MIRWWLRSYIMSLTPFPSCQGSFPWSPLCLSCVLTAIHTPNGPSDQDIHPWPPPCSVDMFWWMFLLLPPSEPPTLLSSLGPPSVHCWYCSKSRLVCLYANDRYDTNNRHSYQNYYSFWIPDNPTWPAMFNLRWRVFIRTLDQMLVARFFLSFFVLVFSLRAFFHLFWTLSITMMFSYLRTFQDLQK